MAVAAEPAALPSTPTPRRGPRARRASTTSSRSATRFIEDCETPVSAFLKLRGAPAPRSCSSPPSRASASAAGRSSAARRARSCAGRSATAATRTRSPPREVGALPPGAARPTLPPFAGGAVGFFGYDCVRAVEPLGEPEPGRARPAGHGADALRRARRLRPPQAHGHDPRQRLRRGRRRRRGAYARARRRRSRRRASGSPARCRAAARRRRRAPSPTFELEHAARGVRGDGRADRRVRPRRRRLPGRARPSAGRADLDVEPFSIYRGLRASTRRPYMYFLDFEDFQIVGASPEPLLTVTGRRVSTRPIAGTRPRGADAGRGRADRRRSCSPTRRSAPST